MGKKSSRSRKGKSAAPKSAPAPTFPTFEFSHWPYGGSGGSSGTTPTFPASPSSLLPMPSVGASTSTSSNSSVAARSPISQVPPQASTEDPRLGEIVQLILDLQDTQLRGNALAQLATKIETFVDLAPLLWYSFGTVTILLQEVLSIYAMFSSPASLTPELSNRLCNVIALFQSLATHSKTRLPFLTAQIPIYLYLVLIPVGDPKPFQRLRRSIVGVISTLVKDPDTEVINSLLASEIMPLCLQTMDNGTEVSRTVATVIVQRLLQDDEGFNYIINLPETMSAVLQALRNTAASLSTKPSIRLLKLVIQCYVRLLDDPRSFCALKNSIPTSIFDGTFDPCLNEDETARLLLQKLVDNVQGPHIILGSVINILV